MQTPSECVESSRWRRTEGGNVLISLLGAVIVLALLGGAVLEIGGAARERALKLQDRDRAVGGIEFGLEALRQTVAQQFESQGWIDVAGLGGNPDQGTGALGSAYYNISLETQNGPGQIFATQLHNPLESLTAPDDPFHGASAVVNTFSVTANAQSAIRAGDGGRFNLPTLQLSPQLSVRQIPVSEFTLFSSATSLELSQGGNIGRIHSQGDLIISGQLSSLYPVTASGNISLAGNGSLVVQPADPGLAPLSFPVQSTLDNSWLALARSTYQSTISSGRNLPLGMVEAAGINRLTGHSPGGATPVAGQELWRQCNRVILETHGKLSLYNSAGAEVTGQEAKGFSGVEAANLIIFDLQKEPPAPGRNSFYIASSNPYAVVVLRNGSSLAGDLSVISPHPIIIEGGFNNQRRAVSLVSGATVIGVQAPATNAPSQQGGTALLMPERALWLGFARLINRSLPAGEAALLLSSRSVEAQMPGFLGNFWGKLIPSLLGNGLERLGGAFSFSPFADGGGGGDGGAGGGGGSGDGGGSSGSGGGGSGSGDGGGSSGSGSAGSGGSGSGSGDGGAGSGSGSAGSGGSGSGSGDGGGSSDGGSTDGSSSSDSSSSDDGDSAAAAAAAAAAADAAAAAEAAAPAQDASANAVAVAAAAVDAAAVTAVAQDAVTNNDVESPLDAIQSQATTDPRGGAAPSSFESVAPSGTPLAAGGPVGLGAGAPPTAPVDIAINAVIVSGANSAWAAVQRGPGARNITVAGGIIALGGTPLPGEPPPGSPQPDWLRVIPDPRLLDGSVIPPVVPNIIDIRWLNCPIQVVEKATE